MTETATQDEVTRLSLRQEGTWPGGAISDRQWITTRLGLFQTL